MIPPSTTTPASIWRVRDFRLLWAGHSISLFGSQITPVALPLIAALTLSATPGQMALLQALQWAPATALGLFAGVLVDRLPRRPVMIACDLGRAALLLAVPLLASLGLLGVELLYAVAVLLGVGGLLWGVADAALLPAVVRPEQLTAANSALGTSGAVARIAGPGLGGILVQWLTAPVALLGDAVSFVGSAAVLAALSTGERPTPPVQRQMVWPALVEGIRFVLETRLLRAFVLSSATLDFFWNMLYALYVLFLTRVLGQQPGALGLILGVGSAGALLGTLLVPRVTAALGVGRAAIGGQLLVGTASLLIPAALLGPALALPLLIAAELIQSCAGTVYGIIRASLFQAATPEHLLGRVSASTTALGLLPAVVGTLAGGALGERLGISGTVIIGAAGSVLGFCWLLGSPLRRLRALPRTTGERR